MHARYSDTLDLLHAVGEQRQNDDTAADSADLAAGQRCKLPPLPLSFALGGICYLRVLLRTLNI